MKRTIFTLLLAATVWLAKSQGEANIWYFGAYAGVDFNSGAPVALTNGALNTGEGSATICDKNGNLLFYTDGIRAWDRTHNQMPNGFGMLGDPSSAQSAIIVPKPGSSTLFYIFTVAAEGKPGGFCYSMVDMTLNGGLGDVLAASKNTQLFTPSVEKCTAIKHANGLYVWVLAHGIYNNRFYAYLVDCNGVNSPVTSDVGQVEGYPGWGYMSISPDGKRVATAMSSIGFEVSDFNDVTGAISNPIFLGHAGGSYGVSFSPNSQLLYGLSIHTGAIYQWNLQAGSPAAVQASAQQVATALGTGASYYGGAIQQGPDGKLYIPDYRFTSLSTINNPNVLGTGCGFQGASVNLLGRQAVLGLPPFIQSFLDTTALITANGNCIRHPVSFSISGTTAYLDSVKWDFGDPASGLANSSSVLTPSHTFNSAGTFQVRLIRWLNCISDTSFLPITMAPSPVHQQSILLCSGGSYTLPSGQVVFADGTYNDTLTAPDGCDSIVETTITTAVTNVSAGADVAICAGDSAQLQATGGFIYSWFPATGLSDASIANPKASPAATTTYAVYSTVRVGANLVSNGDFELGNNGFSSGYIYDSNPPNSPTTQGPGHYSVAPSVSNGWWPGCGDHTSGSGKMMIIDGANGSDGVSPGTDVWCQNIQVVPNTDYAFSTYLTNANAGGFTSQLAFQINGTQVGSTQTTPINPCGWNEFYAIWNSGSNTSATICLKEVSGAQPGNDFAIDDITFYQLCTDTDEVVVTVHDLATTIVDTAICEGYLYTFPGGNTSTVAGSDTAILTDRFGCDSTVITHLTVNPSPVVQVNDTICANQTYTLPSGNTVNTAGVYTDTLQTMLGCDSIVVTTLTVHPVLATTVYDTICSGATYVLADGSTAAVSGTYPVVLTSSFGCDSTVTTQLTVLDLSFTASTADLLCYHDNSGTITASAAGGVLPYHYQLLTGGAAVDSNTTGNFSSLAAAAYSLQIVDDFGCAVSGSSTVNEPTLLQASHSVTDVTCFDARDGQVALTASGGTSPYSFALQTAGNNSDGNFTALAPGAYAFTVTDGHNCTDTGTAIVIQPQKVLITIAPDSAVIRLGENIHLQASGNYSNINYLWQPSFGLSCFDCPDPYVALNSSQVYTVAATVLINGNECYGAARLPVTVIPDYDIFIPNVFTPNGDGANDVFRIFGNLQGVKFAEVKIFARNGEKVYESNDIYFQWDGTYKGQVLPPQVFAYTVSVVFVDNHTEKLFKGSLTLLR